MKREHPGFNMEKIAYHYLKKQPDWGKDRKCPECESIRRFVQLHKAAPELLEALERFAKGDYGPESVRIAKAALKKARGE